MKKTDLLQALLMLIVTLCAASCSKESRDFEQYYGDGVKMACSLNLYEIIDNAGIEIVDGKLNVTPAIKRYLGAEGSKKIDRISSIKGFDPRKVMIVMDSGDNLYLLAKLTDVSAFVDSFNERVSKETDGGYTILIRSDGDMMVIDGDMLIIGIDSDYDGAALVNEIKDNAVDKPAKAWQKDFLNNDKTVNMIVAVNLAFDRGIDDEMGQMTGSVLDSLYGDVAGGYTAITLQLDGLELKAETRLYGCDGEEKTCAWLGQNADKSMLKYMSSDDMAALLATLSGSGWKTLADKILVKDPTDPNQAMLGSLYADLSGKFMLAGGYHNVADLVNSNTKALSLAFAASVTGGGAVKLDQIEKIIKDKGIPYDKTGNQLSIDVPDVAKLYFIADGDNIVMSLNDEPDGASAWIKSGDIGDGSIEFILKVPASEAAMTYIPLPFGIELTGTADSDRGEMVLRLTDTEGKLLENIINFASKF